MVKYKADFSVPREVMEYRQQMVKHKAEFSVPMGFWNRGKKWKNTGQILVFQGSSGIETKTGKNKADFSVTRGFWNRSNKWKKQGRF